MRPWPNVKERRPTIQREFKGVDKRDSFSIPDIFATDESNLSSALYPALSVRPGSSMLGSAVGTRVLGMGVWKDTELHAVFDDGTWRKLTGSAWTTLYSGLNTAAAWSFTNFKGNLTDISLIGSNGLTTLVYDGSTVSTLTAPTGIQFVEQYADRLYGVVGNELKFTTYRQANDWTTVNGDDADSGYIIVETPNGETISGLKPGNTHMTVFKPSSVHELFGSSPSDYRMQVVATGIGMARNNHGVNIGGVLYFLDVTNPAIYQYDGGMAPSSKFAEPVKWYVENMNKAAKLTACVGTDGKNLYVALPMTASYPDTVLAYDIGEGAWDVWRGWNPLHFAKMGQGWYFGDATGLVKQVGGTTDDGTAISSYRVSVPYSGNSLAQKVRLNTAWFTVDIPAGSTFKVSLSGSEKGNDWTEVKSITPTTSLKSVPIYIPTAAVANANYIRVKIEGSGPYRVQEFARDLESLPMV